jgi:transposase
VKGERPNRTAEHKKKTMKTNTNKNRKSGTQSRPEQLSTGSRPQIDFKRRNANRVLNTENLLALLRRETPNFFELAEVVGKWVWIQFDGKQPSDVTRVLAELGFHWNKNRQTWQHPCGVFRDKAASFDPRTIYRSYFPADSKPV